MEIFFLNFITNTIFQQNKNVCKKYLYAIIFILAFIILIILNILYFLSIIFFYVIIKILPLKLKYPKNTFNSIINKI